MIIDAGNYVNYVRLHINVSYILFIFVFLSFLEAIFKKKDFSFHVVSDITADLSSPDIEGVYETQVPLDFRALVDLGCLVTVDRNFAKMMSGRVREFSACCIRTDCDLRKCSLP